MAYAAGATYPFTSTATLYARWVAAPLRTVTFNANGGNETMANQSANVATALTANAFTRPGYVFDGWATTSNGSNAYANGASFPFTANAALYARWACKPFTVTATARRWTTGKVIVRYTSTSEVPMTTLTATDVRTSFNSNSITRSENGGQIIVSMLEAKKTYQWRVTGTNIAGCSATSETTTPAV
jgi:uncharacterized repeat protein (TIGR02543 family)